jgi:NADPH:quinone reductase-like Zn-dependent oxidoreductase
MRAVMFVPRPGGASVEIADVPKAEPAPGEVLVRVRAAGLNRGEMSIRRGLTSGAPQQTGIEFAGEVAASGAGATRFKAGDRVMGHWRGGQAEFVAADERLLVPVPPRLSWIEAGAWLNVFVTAHDAIVSNAGLRAGESILVNAASSGIGVAALQIARLLGAGMVIGSSRSAAKLEKLRQYGMQKGVLADAGAAAITEATGGKGVDVLIDSVGGAALAQNLTAMAVRGRMVSVGRLASNSGEIDLDLLALKRIRLIGVTFRTRTKEERIECVQRCAADLWEPLADGRLQPVVQRSFRMEDINEAHEYMERDEHIGKLVIEIGL